MHIILLLFLLVTLLFHFVTYGLIMFTCLITCDGVFSAINFLYMYIKNGVSKTDAVKNTSLLYSMSCIDRYIWYMLCALLYQTICGILWIGNMKILLACGILLNLPPIQNFLTYDPKKDVNSIDDDNKEKTMTEYIHMVTRPFFGQITKIKKMIVIELLSKQLSAIVNSIAKNVLGKKKKIISHRDIRKLFDNYTDMMDNVVIIIKNILFVLVITYLKTKSNYYYAIAKRIYNFKAESSINTMTRHEVNDMLDNICEKKQWSLLLEPDFIQVIIHMYFDEEFKNKDNIFAQHITNIQYSMLKFFAVWTISSFLVYPVIGPLIFYLMYYYKWRQNKTYTKITAMKLTSISLGFVVSFFVKSFPIVCFVSEFAYYLVFNNITFQLYKLLTRKGKQLVVKYNNISPIDEVLLVLNTICGASLYFLVDPSTNIHVVFTFASLLSATLLLHLQSDMRKITSLVLVLLIGVFSAYNIFHVVLNMHHYYLITNYIYSDHFNNAFYYIKYKSKYKLHKYLDKYNEELKIGKKIEIFKSMQIKDIKSASSDSLSSDDKREIEKSHVTRKKRNIIAISNYFGEDAR